MKLKYALLILTAIFTSFSYAGNVKKITCAEVADGDEGQQTIGAITVELDETGTASYISYRKQAWENSSALNLQFSRRYSTIQHDVQKNTVEGIDEDTKKPIYPWNIEDVEVVNATNSKGDSIKFILNDHRYSGTPGSTVEYKLAGNIGKNNGTLIICDGFSKVKP